ncbi:N-acetylgalactosamine-6-sulfatase [Haloferula helveola]|uniref:N-acetylgalactosamine-6-sulfatase n=1 Tax=Haloferula helveola TaxID=490095 RepID=A0ABN6H6G6_9BACT|nr:N-acetylgalactosamine-6-sulfatase [Haloferula helveola]
MNPAPCLRSLAAGLIFAGAALAAPERPPNFVIILADDMGYGDAGCYGSKALKTPHLDRMAERGLRFTDFHSSGNVCSPTRAGLVTGRYQYRSGVDGVVNADPKVPAHHSGLQRSEHTFAESLKAKGYQVGLMGKWHLGYDKKYNPTHHGFDRFRGFVSGNIDYHSHYDRMGVYDWWDGLEQVKEEGYSTHLINRHAVEFIEEHKDKPFCLYVAHEAVHSPWQGPEDPAVRGPGVKKGAKESPKDVALKAMMTAMDQGIGEIISKLEELELAENTLVFFFSDNGPAGGSAGPLRGRKGSNWEGGHRVPAVAFWPGKIKAGQVTDELSISIDLMPTMLELSGASAHPERPLDGVSLVPVLLRGESLGERQLFWNHKAMRDGNWKLMLGGKGAAGEVGLYDLSKDIGEKNNLAKQHPERVETMRKALKAWSEDVMSNVTAQPDVEAVTSGKKDAK